MQHKIKNTIKKSILTLTLISLALTACSDNKAPQNQTQANNQQTSKQASQDTDSKQDNELNFFPVTLPNTSSDSLSVSPNPNQKPSQTELASKLEVQKRQGTQETAEPAEPSKKPEQSGQSEKSTQQKSKQPTQKTQKITQLPFTKKTSQNGKQRPLSQFPLSLAQLKKAELNKADWLMLKIIFESEGSEDVKRSGFYQLPNYQPKANPTQASQIKDTADIQVFMVFQTVPSESLEVTDTTGLTIDEIERQTSYLITVNKGQTTKEPKVHILPLANKDFRISKGYQQIVNIGYDFNSMPVYYQLLTTGEIIPEPNRHYTLTLPLIEYDLVQDTDKTHIFATEQLVTADKKLSAKINRQLQPQFRSMLGGASDSGFYTLPSIGDIEVFIAYGLFEDSDPKYVSDDNPDGMFVNPLYYLLALKDGVLHSQKMDTFSIEKDYKTISLDLKNYEISTTGKILPVDKPSKANKPVEFINDKNLQQFFATNRYQTFRFDINADGKRDLIIANKRDKMNGHQGDDLFVYLAQKTSPSYKLDLSTTNFDADGGFAFTGITPRADNNGFILTTSFPDRGISIHDYMFTKQNNKWFINQYVSKGSLVSAEAYYCIGRVNYNVTDNIGAFDPDKGMTDKQRLKSCPPPAIKYLVTAEKAEILNEKFLPNQPANYFLKGDTITQKDTFFKQNQDWIHVSYKDGKKTGWVKRQDLKAME